MSWLNAIVRQHAELESPPSFWKWAALAAISAVVKDNVWMDRQIFRTYPNIYVMLHAESGMKKGPPISMAKQLVRRVNNTRIITGRSSIQGILKELGTAQTKPGGKVEAKSVAFICSSELSSSIVEDKVATTILTDLYDRQYNEGEWRSLLKMETFQLKDPTISMLTATNEAMSEDFFTRSAIQGGYFARTFIIYEKESIVNNSLTYPLMERPNYDQLGDYLKELADLRGQFKPFAALEKSEEYSYPKLKKHQGGDRLVFFNETGLLYDNWYDDFRDTIKQQGVKDETGTLNRFGDSVLKVAMVMALAEKPVLEITPDIMARTIVECEKLIGNVRQTTIGKQGTSDTAQLKTAVIMELLNRETHEVTRELLMRKMWMHFNTAQEFDDLMTSFHHAGLVKTGNIGDKLIYYMPPEIVGEMQNFMAGKNK